MQEFDSFDQEFKNQVVSRPGGERATSCFLCGTCTAGCPVSALDNEYNPRRIIRMVLLGMKKDILSSPEIWHCSQCHTCVAHCPQDVRLADVIRVLRQIALEEGYVTRGLVDEIEKLELKLKQERIERLRELTK